MSELTLDSLTRFGGAGGSLVSLVSLLFQLTFTVKSYGSREEIEANRKILLKHWTENTSITEGHDEWRRYSFAQAHGAHSLAELGGVVRLELVRASIELHTVPMQSARTLLLGHCPRAGAKVAVAEAFRAAGACFETLDEYDAMAVANWGLSELGGFCFCQTMLPQVG